MEYANTDLPNEVTKAELLLRDHKSGRGRMQEMINYTAEEGDQIVVRVRQQVCGISILREKLCDIISLSMLSSYSNYSIKLDNIYLFF